MACTTGNAEEFSKIIFLEEKEMKELFQNVTDNLSFVLMF